MKTTEAFACELEFYVQILGLLMVVAELRSLTSILNESAKISEFRPRTFCSHNDIVLQIDHVSLTSVDSYHHDSFA